MAEDGQYGVNFVGYSAHVMKRDNADEIIATLSFVTGDACVSMDESDIQARSRAELRHFLRRIDAKKRRLERLIHESGSAGAELQDKEFTVKIDHEDGRVTLEADGNSAQLRLGTKLDHFVQKFSKRLAEIEDILRQAEEIGMQIERMPYSEYIENRIRDGFFLMERQGFAIYEEGRLKFTPMRQVGKVYPVDPSGTEFIIEMTDPMVVH